MDELSRLASTPRIPGAKVQIARLAERQSGIVTRTQLLQSGVGAATIWRWTQNGHLHRIHQGVYSVGHRALTTKGHLVAALFYAGRGAALSHASAANWWGLVPYLPRSTHVCSPSRRRSLPGVHVHHADRIDRVRHRGLPVTTLARTLLDFASVAPPPRLRRAVAEADYLRLLDLAAIDAILGRGRPGSAALRKALERHRPQYARTLSVLEDRFLELCQRYGIRLPEVNVMVEGLMVDALWRKDRVIVELDGHAAHSTRSAMNSDRDRELILRTAGYLVARYTWRQISERPAEVAADLKCHVRD